jgi:hypothetical protein
MEAIIEKNGAAVLTLDVVRFTQSDGNLTLTISGTNMIDNPLVYGKLYTVKIVTPEQTITSFGMYLSYTYVLYSQNATDENGQTVTTYNVADNGLLFKIID